MGRLRRDFPAAEIDALYRAHAPAIYRVCLRYVKDDADALDLVHSAFEKVIGSDAPFRGESAVFTWIYRIAVNESLQFLRRRKGRPDGQRMLEEELDCAAAEEGDLHLRISLRQVLRTLRSRRTGNRGACIIWKA